MTGQVLRLNYIRTANRLVAELDRQLGGCIVTHPGLEYELHRDDTRLTYRRYPCERTLTLERTEGQVKYDVVRREVKLEVASWQERFELDRYGVIRSYDGTTSMEELEGLFLTFSLMPFLAMKKE